MKETDSKFDLRVVQQHLKKGTLDHKDYDKHLKSLPDSKENADYIQVFEEDHGEGLVLEKASK